VDVAEWFAFRISGVKTETRARKYSCQDSAQGAQGTFCATAHLATIGQGLLRECSTLYPAGIHRQPRRLMANQDARRDCGPRSNFPFRLKASGLTSARTANFAMLNTGIGCTRNELTGTLPSGLQNRKPAQADNQRHVRNTALPRVKMFHRICWCLRAGGGGRPSAERLQSISSSHATSLFSLRESFVSKHGFHSCWTLVQSLFVPNCTHASILNQGDRTFCLPSAVAVASDNHVTV